jgi:putative DNA primase/helicase
MPEFKKIDFQEVKRLVRGYEDILFWRLLPHARKKGHEYVALNPTRHDRHLGSFRINSHSFKWADFATGDKGSDIISLWAYIRRITQLQAAKEILTIVEKD